MRLVWDASNSFRKAQAPVQCVILGVSHHHLQATTRRGRSRPWQCVEICRGEAACRAGRGSRQTGRSPQTLAPHPHVHRDGANAGSPGCAPPSPLARPPFAPDAARPAAAGPPPGITRRLSVPWTRRRGESDRPRPGIRHRRPPMTWWRGTAARPLEKAPPAIESLPRSPQGACHLRTSPGVGLANGQPRDAPVRCAGSSNPATFHPRQLI